MIEIKRRPQAASGSRKSFAGAYHAIYRAIAEYHEQHYPPRLTDEYWQSAIEGIKALSIRFEGEAYAKALKNPAVPTLSKCWHICLIS